MRIQLPPSILAVVLVPTAVAACGASSHALPPGGAGTYIRPSYGAESSTALTLHPDGRFTQTVAGFQPNGTRGVWSFSNGRITFAETTRIGPCGGERGTYRWSYAHKTLTLTRVSDPCGHRVADFQLGPWKKGS
jgi:hypothetical protein